LYLPPLFAALVPPTVVLILVQPALPSMPSARVQTVIKNKLGLHARPAMVFVDAASAFQASVAVEGNGQSVDGKSIMMMMLLAATQGTPIEIICDGPDAEAACEALKKLVDNGFDEQ
jgi:phosphocarrier protein HPr